MMRNIILFDEPQIREQLYPFSLTRSIGAIRVGIATIAEKWEFYLQGKSSFLTADYLQEKYPLRLTEDNYFIASHRLPDDNLVKNILKLKSAEALFYNQQLLAFHGSNWEDHLYPVSKINYEDEVTAISHPFHIFQLNAAQLIKDMGWITSNKHSQSVSSSNIIFGNHSIFVEEGATINACILNAEQGPIYIGKNAVIMEGACIRGPFAMLDNAVVKMGAKIYGATTLGPHCIAGGEIKNSVLFGYSNKSHDGYLGDAVIGEWCNLGANTNSSNLKNNAGTVRIWSEALQQYIPAGQKCGLIMGDYSRCGISTMLNTGTVIGISCNIFGGDFPPKHIPSFSWGGASKWMRYEYDKAIKDADAWMRLKEKNITKSEENILQHVYHRQKENR